MSYDLRIATHLRPPAELVETWASEQGFAVVADGQSLVVERPSRGDTGYICEVWGPDPAEPEDFDEELAEACLAPKWMVLVSVPYSVPKAHRARARSLARYIAEHSEGAAFDAQEDRLLWPRGKQKRTSARAADEQTSVLELDWFVEPSRWTIAVESLVPLLTRRCPEALPTRYGEWEPPPNRFDRSTPSEFTNFIALSEAGDGFWYAARPSFGGSFMAPHSDTYASGEDERFRIGQVKISFDCRLIADDTRWLEAITDLFVRGAEVFGAFFAAAQVEPGWTVTRNNRLFATAASLSEGEHFLRGRLWQGLPPVPVWLSWYGDPYRPLVKQALLKDRAADGGEVEERDTGIFVRLSSKPLPRPQLPPLGLPEELIYRERRAVEYPGGGWESNPAKPEDRAAVIPQLGASTS